MAYVEVMSETAVLELPLLCLNLALHSWGAA